MDKKTKNMIYEEYMSTKARLISFKGYYGEVAYCYLNQKEYAGWGLIPSAQDMVRISITYENLMRKLNNLYKEWFEYVKLNYSNEQI